MIIITLREAIMTQTKDLKQSEIRILIKNKIRRILLKSSQNSVRLDQKYLPSGPEWFREDSQSKVKSIMISPGENIHAISYLMYYTYNRLNTRHFNINTIW